jgi:hypothetical protein
MAFLNITFPTGVGFHRVGGDAFNTSVITTSSGQEYRNGNWSAQRRKFTISMITPAQVGGVPTNRLAYALALRDFFLQAQGKLNSFIFHDPIVNEDVRVRFDTDEFNLQIEPSDVAGGNPVVSWNSLVLVEVRPPNY